MDWIKNLNSAILYIEENLTEKIEYGKLAQIAGCSTFHFQRMFAYMANVPLSEYIRRRRMSEAAKDLQQGSNKVLDVALKYGYESPTAFNRAFKSIHNIAPSQASKEGVELKMYTPISFSISIKGEQAMDYKIEIKDEVRVVGFCIDIEMNLEENFNKIPVMWEKTMSSGKISELVKFMNTDLKAVLGITDFRDEQGKYFIAVASTLPIEDTLYEEVLIPQHKWAVFHEKGTSKTIQQLEKRIYTEWLPDSGYEYGIPVDVEVYISPDPQQAEYEVWVPIK